MRQLQMLRTSDLAIAEIRTDGGTQPRAALSDVVVQKYAERMTEGVVFPPIAVVFDGTLYWLADGFHRVAAAKRNNVAALPAVIYAGTLQDAQWFSYGANASHGETRSRADEIRAIKMALQHPFSRQLSDRELARHVGVSHPTIAKYRAELEAGGVEMPEQRIASNGRKVNIRRDGATTTRVRQAAPPLVRVRRIWQEASDAERRAIFSWVAAQDVVVEHAA